MSFHQLLHYALNKKFTVQQVDVGGKSAFVVSEKIIVVSDNNASISPEVKAIASKFTEDLIGNLVSFFNPAKRNFISIFDEFERLLYEVTDQQTLHSVFDELLNNGRFSKQFEMVFEKFKSTLASDANQQAKIIFLAFYFPEEKFKEIFHGDLKDAALKTEEDIELFVRLLNTLPNTICFDVINDFIQRQPDRIQSLFHQLTRVPLSLNKYKIFLRAMAGIENEEIKQHMFNNFLEDKLMAFLGHANYQQIVEFFNILDTPFYKKFAEKWYGYFIPILWYLHSNNINRNHVFAAIKALSPEIKKRIDQRIYYPLKPIASNFKLGKPSGTASSLFNPTQETLKLHHQFLFETTEMSAIQKVMSELRTIFFNPTLVVELLQDFEKQLVENWKKNFGDINVKDILPEVKTVSIANLPWKIPQKKSHFSTHGFLSEQIIAFLKARGFGKNAYKATYFIDPEDFKALIKSGDFFSESALNSNFILHGKTIHNLGRIVIILAWERGFLSHKDKISIQDIFDALVNQDIVPKDDDLLFSVMLDAALSDMLNFSDPLIFHSMLMSACDESLPLLSGLLTHSLVNALYKLQDFVNTTSDLHLNLDEIVDLYIKPRVQHITLSVNSSNDIASKMKQYLIAKQKLGSATNASWLFYRKSFNKHVDTKYDNSDEDDSTLEIYFGDMKL